jgi:dTDP-4-dehydrorhamnose 3,5-epimerase
MVGTVHHFEPTEESLIETDTKKSIHATPIDGLYFLEPSRFDDERGFYAELSRLPEIEVVTDEPFQIKQLNLSHSKQDVIRGLHAENWNKLITITCGTAFCAWVDVRPSSKTFGDVVTVEMGEAETALQGSIFVEAGIANSFLVTKGPVNYLYAVDQLYAERDSSGDVALNLFDKELDIPWPIAKDDMIISERDREAKDLYELFPEKKHD